MVEVITSYQLAFRRNRKLRELEDTVKLIQYYDAQRNAGGLRRSREVRTSAEHLLQ